MSVHRNTRYKDKTKSPNRQEIRRLFRFEATVSTCLDTFSLGSFKVANEVYEATSAISFEVNLISQRKKISKYRSSLHTKGYLINYQSIII